MRRLFPLVAVMLVAGCGGPTDPAPPDTGAKAAGEGFFSALVANDPARAYALLDPDTRKRVSADQFATLARTYLRRVGFPVEHVYVRASEEQGDRATVHVTLTGNGGGHTRRYADGVTLRREAGVWSVVLPVTFGK